MSKKPITLILADEEVTAHGYTTEADGLVVHREYRYSPSKKTHRETSKWTVSHEGSGKTLLLPSQMLSTRMEAFALAERLAKFDWTQDIKELDATAVWEATQHAIREVSNEDFSRDTHPEGHHLEDLTSNLGDYDGRYGMRTEGRGRDRTYVIYNKETDEVVERMALPGTAAERVAELNRESE